MKGVIKQLKCDRKQQESYNERSEVIEKKISNETKEDIKHFKATNEEIIEKIKLIEEESFYETDEESERVAETKVISSFVSKPKVEIENKNPAQLYRWHIWHSCYSASVTHKKPQCTCSAWSDRCRHEYGPVMSEYHKMDTNEYPNIFGYTICTE